MSARAMLALGLALAGASLAAAGPRPQIPPSEMAGRERERFIDKFPQREPAGPVFTVPGEAKSAQRRKCRSARGSRPRKVC